MPEKKRSIIVYKDYFDVFFAKQRRKVQEKIGWSLKVIEQLDIIPELYLKHLVGTDGLYEIRVQQGSGIFHISCFFDEAIW